MILPSKIAKTGGAQAMTMPINGRPKSVVPAHSDALGMPNGFARSPAPKCRAFPKVCAASVFLSLSFHNAARLTRTDSTQSNLDFGYF